MRNKCVDQPLAHLAGVTSRAAQLRQPRRIRRHTESGRHRLPRGLDIAHHSQSDDQDLVRSERPPGLGGELRGKPGGQRSVGDFTRQGSVSALPRRSGIRRIRRGPPPRRPAGITMLAIATGMIVTPASAPIAGSRAHPDADAASGIPGVGPLAARDALLNQSGLDAVMTRLPFPTDQLHVTILYDELPRMLAVPIDHRLAGSGIWHRSTTIADEPMPQVRHSDPAWSAFWRIDPWPDAPTGHPVARSSKRLRTSSSSSRPGTAVAITRRIQRQQPRDPRA